MANMSGFQYGGHQQPPLEIYRDDTYQDDFPANAPPMVNRAPMPTAPNRRALQPAINRHNHQLSLPNSDMQSYPQSQYTPSMSPRTPVKPSQGNRLSQMSMTPPAINAQHTDSMLKKQLSAKPYQPVAQKPSRNSTNEITAKDSSHPKLLPAPAMPGSGVFQQQNHSTKRSLHGSANNGRASKKPKLDAQHPLSSSQQPQSNMRLPQLDALAQYVDDGKKPYWSYAQIIAMAIQESPGHRLTLAQIYDWIMRHFSFYEKASKDDKGGWQNSIRHNLSLNKAFVKQERGPNDPGKGHYWVIRDDADFFPKDRLSRKKSVATEENTAMMSRFEPAKPPQLAPRDQHPLEPSLPPQLPMSHASFIPPDSDQHPSTDATIPASDLLEDGLPSNHENDAVATLDFSHFPSSPPISRPRSKTPTHVAKPGASSGPRGRKLKRGSMGDSGYISSLDSSSLRPTQDRRLPHYKNGSAEQEILRVRGQSSPSLGRSEIRHLPALSSSPLGPTFSLGSIKDLVQMQMPPPRTPAAAKTVKPRLLPPSSSPRKCLQKHRENILAMENSPLKRANAAASIPGKSPWKIETPGYIPYFELFSPDTGLHVFGADGNGSPTKRSTIKRPRPYRAFSPPIFHDIAIDSPFSPGGNAMLDYLDFSSPSKVNLSKNLAHDQLMKKIGTIGGSGLDQENLSHDLSDEEGLDMCQGFTKIGSIGSIRSPVKPRLGL